jgi:hypothetical protein
MRTIAKSHILLRDRIELPDDLRLSTEEFCENWNFVRSTNALRLGERLILRGWSFARIASGPMRNGVGDTLQEAIVSGLKLALHHVGTRFNAAEIEHIELTQYPWFFLAKVRVLPCIIQKGVALSVTEASIPSPVARRPRRLPLNSAALYPDFGLAMPMLKEMLITSRSAQTMPQ